MKTIIEGLAEKLHEWYLEATSKLNPESYNPEAQKKYKDLTGEQKFIDRFIAKKILTEHEASILEKVKKAVPEERIPIIENSEADKFEKEIKFIRGYFIEFKDEHGQVLYTFKKKKEADEFYRNLTTRLNLNNKAQTVYNSKKM